MKYFGITDRGLVRKNNQDSYVIASNQADDILAIVADGIGGNLGGDIASRLAVSHFSRAFSEVESFSGEREIVEWIEEHVERANTLIFEYGKKHIQLKGMGTTLCAAMLTKFGTFVINIGDSRCYSWSKELGLKQITIDHTLLNDMLAHGELKPEEAKTFTKKNVLTNALGVWETVKADIDIHHETMQGLLLCSDGLHGYVSERDINNVLFNTDLDVSLKPRKLLKYALEAGGFDNITIILIDFEGDNNYGKE